MPIPYGTAPGEGPEPRMPDTQPVAIGAALVALDLGGSGQVQMAWTARPVLQAPAVAGSLNQPLVMGSVGDVEARPVTIDSSGNVAVPLASSLFLGDQSNNNTPRIYSPSEGLLRISGTGAAREAVRLQFDAVTGSVNTAGTLTVAPTWTSAFTSYTASRVNVTDTASLAGSLLQDWQVGGVSKAKIDKAGAATFSGQVTVGSAANFTIEPVGSPVGAYLQANGTRAMLVTASGMWPGVSGTSTLGSVSNGQYWAEVAAVNGRFTGTITAVGASVINSVSAPVLELRGPDVGANLDYAVIRLGRSNVVPGTRTPEIAAYRDGSSDSDLQGLKLRVQASADGTVAPIDAVTITSAGNTTLSGNVQLPNAGKIGLGLTGVELRFLNTHQIGLLVSGAERLRLGDGYMEMKSAGYVGWNSTGNPTGSPDTRLQRVSAGTVGIYQGDGTTLGTLRAGTVASTTGILDFTDGNANMRLSSADLTLRQGASAAIGRSISGLSRINLCSDASGVLPIYQTDTVTLASLSAAGATFSGNILLNAAAPILYFGNDSDQYITGNAASNYLTISTANAERVRVTSAGSVLVATTTDDGVNKLQVSGNAKVSNNLTVGNLVQGAQFLDPSNRGVGIVAGVVSLQASTTSPIVKGSYNGDTTISPARDDANNFGDVVIRGGGVERIRMASATGATTFSGAVSVTPAWNNVATAFNAILVNATDTASAASSKLLNMQTGSASRFSVRKDGATTVTQAVSMGAAFAIYSTPVTGNQSITMAADNSQHVVIILNTNHAARSAVIGFNNAAAATPQPWRMGIVDGVDFRIEPGSAGSGNIGGSKFSLSTAGALTLGSSITAAGATFPTSGNLRFGYVGGRIEFKRPSVEEYSYITHDGTEMFFQAGNWSGTRIKFQSQSRVEFASPEYRFGFAGENLLTAISSSGSSLTMRAAGKISVDTKNAGSAVAGFEYREGGAAKWLLGSDANGLTVSTGATFGTDTRWNRSGVGAFKLETYYAAGLTWQGGVRQESSAAGPMLAFYDGVPVLQPAALTAANVTAAAGTDAAIIENLRTRVNELENRLVSLNLIAA